MKLLIVEDSARLRKSLAEGLKKLGYTVDTAEDGEIALKHLESMDYDVLILDIMMPKVDGLSVLKQIREKRNRVHVLILSAKGQVEDRIKGLELGADDYLIKPFSFDELNARICALMRRAHDSKSPLMSVGAFEFNSALKQLSFDQKKVNLTPHETSLLEYILLNRGHIVSYEQLELKLYNWDAVVSRNAIEAHMSSLRKKLKKYDATEIIKTKRGFGYYVE